MRIGAHVDDDDPAGASAERDTSVVQFFLSDPASWRAPRPHPQADLLRCAELEVYVHSPYVITVTSLNNRIRIPSRKLLTQHAAAAAAVGASGLVIHGGHVTQGDE